MMTAENIIRDNLLELLSDIRKQSEVGAKLPTECLPFAEQMEQLREWIEDVGEYGIAYESLVSLLQDSSFVLSSRSAIKLLEIGLLFKFKTDFPEDAIFDSRS